MSWIKETVHCQIRQRNLIQTLIILLLIVIIFELELFSRRYAKIQIFQYELANQLEQSPGSGLLHSGVHKEPAITELPPGQQKSMKYILHYDFVKNDTQDPFSDCPISNCYITRNFSTLNSIANFDAIMIHPVYYRRNYEAFKLLRKLEPYRSKRQIWIADMGEAPRWTDFSYVNREFLSRNVFNWTLSVWPDSDIWRPWRYTFIKDFDRSLGPFWDKFPTHFEADSIPPPGLSEKTGLVFWVVSHCPTMSKREKYVKALQQYIPVDIFGGCGNMTGCPKGEGNDCHKRLAKKYKFYLAFENAVCHEYVTEKFTRTLFKPMVPIVLGGSDYSSWAPEHSYIDVFDFPSPKALAEHLLYLDKNNDEYLKYFEWKEKYVGFRRRQMGNCELCAKLNDPNEPEKVIQNLYEWWYYTNSGDRVCKWVDKPLKYYSSRNTLPLHKNIPEN